jgi:type IV pilus assembly protein PilE
MENYMNHAKRSKHTSGFTLIEVMVVVAIIAILAAIAVPQYSDYLLRGKLTEATATLGQMRVSAEQYFQDNRMYTGMPQCTASSSKYFDYTCTVVPSGAVGTATSTVYTLSATGKATQGTGGFVFTVDQTNTRSTTVASPAPASWQGTFTCWVSKAGHC